MVDIDALDLAPGSVIGITGPSGSGKTSLLYLLAGIERPQAGSIQWDALDLTGLGERAADAWRRRSVGFVFQDFHLLPGLSIEANVIVSAWFGALTAPAELRQRARDLLSSVGAPQDNRPIVALSRGERQRVAMARALINRPSIILADEPTASLDAASGAAVIDLLLTNAAQTGATMIVVTHDPHFIERLPAVYWLQEGRLSPR